MSVKLILMFVSAIPDLIKLLKAIEQAQSQAAVKKKVTDDLKTIHEAFASKDAKKITSLFEQSKI